MMRCASILSISCSIFSLYFTINFSSIFTNMQRAYVKCFMAVSKLSSSLYILPKLKWIWMALMPCMSFSWLSIFFKWVAAFFHSDFLQWYIAQLLCKIKENLYPLGMRNFYYIWQARSRLAFAFQSRLSTKSKQPKLLQNLQTI